MMQFWELINHKVYYWNMKNLLEAELYLTSLISSENCCAVETAIFDVSLGGQLHKNKSS